MDFKKIACSVIVLLFSSFRICSQQYVPLSEEAPPALFQTKLGDADVDLMLLGSWELSLTGSLGMGFSTGEQTFSTAAFPGMTPGLVFKQVPDLTISLWLMQKYFFETSIYEDFSDSTFLLGYRGEEPDFLRSVRIGNTDIVMEDYSYLTLPNQPRGSLGAFVHMESDNTFHEALLRYDPAEQVEVRYRGNREMTSFELEITDYLQGQFFILPDDNLGDMKVYVEDQTGRFRGSDGRYYEEASADMISIDGKNGMIIFSSPVSGRAAVIYEKDGTPVGDESLGTGFLPAGSDIDVDGETKDFNWDSDFLGQPISDFQIEIEGTTALLLQRPGLFSPFQMCNLYTLPVQGSEETEINCIYADKSGKEETLLPIETDSDLGVFTLFFEDLPRRDMKNRYPFGETYPDNYGPDRETRPAFFKHILEITALDDGDGIYIEQDAIAGSVQVKVNGMTESRFQHDPDSGKITFPFFIFPDDVIEIRYKKASDTRSGNINIGFGNRFEPLPGLIINGGIGLVWNVLSGSYSSRQSESPGSLLAAAGLDYEKENLHIRFDAGVSVSTPDTKGIFRVAGMEESGSYIPISEGIIYPASVPSTAVDPEGTLTAAPETRGALIYKNYRSSALFTGTIIMPYSWVPDSSAVFPYESGSKTGPYTALTGDTGADTGLMILDFQITAEKPWVGAQIMVSPDAEGEDLSAAESISFYMLGENLPEGMRLFLHAGSISEDLDGDGSLDAEESEDDSGFEFNDTAAGAVLYIGGGPEGVGNGEIDSEDSNGNGILDTDIEEYIVIREIEVPGDGWTLTEIRLTDEERKKLRNTRAVRLIAYGQDNAAAGRLLVGGISFEGSAVFAEADAPGIISSRDIYEFQTGADGSEFLSALFPETDEYFHADGSSQKILEVQWSDVPADGGWSVSKYSKELPLYQYRKAAFFIRTGAYTPGTGGTVNIDITDGSGQGLTAGFPAPLPGEWHKVEIDLIDETLTIDGESAADAAVSYSRPGSSALQITISGRGMESGTIYFDEIYLKEAIPSAAAGGEGSIEWRYPGPILRAGSFPLLQDFRLYQEAAGSTSGFASGFIYEDGSGIVRTRTETEITAAIFRLHLNFDLLHTVNDIYMSGGHRVNFPVQWSFINLSDSYRETNSPGNSGFTRNNNMSLNIPGAANITLEQNAHALGETLEQTWKAGLATAFSIPFSFNGDFNLKQTSLTFSRDPENYFAGWGESYLLFLPWQEYAYPEKSWDTELTLNAATQPVGFSMKQTMEFLHQGVSQRLQENGAAFEISLPVVFNSDSPFAVTLTSAYSREIQSELPVSFGMGYGEAFSVFGNSFRDLAGFYAGVPFAELFDSPAADLFMQTTEGYQSVLYTPSASLTFSRKSGSFIRDLFIPSEMAIEFARDLERDGEEMTDESVWNLQLRNTGLNLFGRLGAYPLFSFYETEQISTVIDLTFNMQNRTAFQGVDLGVQNIFYIEGAADWKISAENKVDFTYSPNSTDRFATADTLMCSFIWQVPAPFSLPFEFIDREYREALYFESTESLETVIGPGFSETSEESVGGAAFTVLASHETKLVVPLTGFISAKVTLGFDRSSPYAWYAGIQGGIEGKLNF